MEIMRNFNSPAEGPAASNGSASISDEEKEHKLSQIKIWHFIAFLFLGMQTIVYGVMGTDATVRPTVGFPIQCDNPICIPHMRVLGKINSFFIVTLFVAVGSFGHLLSWIIASCFPKISMKWLFIFKSNPIRWLQYSVAGPIMAVAVAIFSGIQDVHIWYLIYVMHAITMLLGFVLEIFPFEKSSLNLENDSCCHNKIKLLIFMAGLLSQFLAWMVIFCYFFYSVHMDAGDILDFRYVAFCGTFFLFSCIGMNLFLCNVAGFYLFHNAEIMYVIFGVLAQTLLAAAIFGGIRAYKD